MPLPFACDMTAIPTAERGTHHELTRRLMSQVLQGIDELPDGLAFRFPAEEYDAAARFIALERLCCPFIDFTLNVSPERGPLRLELRGAEGVKSFIRAELGLA